MSEVTVIEGEEAMTAFGRTLAGRLENGCLVFVRGDLGAGKTTLIRGIIDGFGCRGPVPSPTYTLVETYRSGDARIAHLDLYRLNHSDELEMLGVRDLIGDFLCVIEWPERAAAALPRPDWEIGIRRLEGAREVRVEDCAR